MKKVYEIDGANFKDLEGFFDEISVKLIPGANWGHTIDAFNDILSAGFGTPDEAYVLIWKNHEISKVSLGYEATGESWRGC
jgi:RNAse (barnase) inhibitor barstar